MLSKAFGEHGFLVMGIGQRQIFSNNHLRIDASLFVQKEEALHPNQIEFKKQNLRARKIFF